MNNNNKQIRLINDSIYTYWQALYLSFYSSRLYIDVAKRWKGFGVTYLFLVIALAAIPLSVSVLINFNYFFEEQLSKPISKLPPLYIQKGEVKFDNPMPYFIKNDKNEVIIIIDTSENTQNIKKYTNDYSQLNMLITKSKVYFRSYPFSTQKESQTSDDNNSYYEHTLDESDNEVFVGREWLNSSAVVYLKRTMQLLLYPLIAMIFFGIYLVMLFTIGFLGQLFSQILFHFKLSLITSCRILSVAATPQIVILFLLLTFKFDIPNAGLMNIALISVYYSYAVLSVRRESNQVVRL